MMVISTLGKYTSGLEVHTCSPRKTPACMLSSHRHSGLPVQSPLHSLQPYAFPTKLAAIPLSQENCKSVRVSAQ